MKRVNVIMAHNSPVLIVQRFVRGFLVRKRIRVSSGSQWYLFLSIARLFLQRLAVNTEKHNSNMIFNNLFVFYCVLCCFDCARSSVDFRAKDSVKQIRAELKQNHNREIKEKGTVMHPPASPVSASRTELINPQMDHTSTFEESTIMDYDTYMLNRRPGSTSDASAMNTNRYGVEVKRNSAAC